MGILVLNRDDAAEEVDFPVEYRKDGECWHGDMNAELEGITDRMPACATYEQRCENLSCEQVARKKKSGDFLAVEFFCNYTGVGEPLKIDESSEAREASESWGVIVPCAGCPVRRDAKIEEALRDDDDVCCFGRGEVTSGKKDKEGVVGEAGG